MWLSLLIALPLLQDAPAPAPVPVPPDAPAAAPEFTPLFSLEASGLESLLVDDKDQGLARALRMIDDRLLELPTEIPGWEAPPGTLELLLNLLAGPSSLTIGMSSEPIAAMPMPFAGELRLTKASPEAAQAIAKDVANFASMLGVPLADPDEGGKWLLPAPVPVWMGSDGDGVVLRLGMESGVSKPDTSHLLPEGATMSSGGMLNYGRMMETMMPMIAAEDPDLQTLLQASMVDTLNMEWASGTDAERSYTVFNMPGWAAVAKEQGLLAAEDLDAKIVAAIPGDATWAVASTLNLSGLISYYETVLKLVTKDEYLSLQKLCMEYANLDLNAEVLGTLGNHVALYASDSTGGGGMLSTIGLLELADRDGFLKTWGRLEQALGALGQAQANGYVRFSHLQHGDQDLSILGFPGLPVPMELTMTTTERFVIFGMTPSAVVAAVEQVNAGERTSLLGNPDFIEQLPGRGQDMEGVHSVDWVNTPRLMRDGYSVVSLLCSGLSNAVRSPSDESRSAGLIMPTMATLRSGAKGMLSVGRVVGDDLRAEMRGDRSQLVNATGIMGYMANSPVGPLVAAMVMGSAVVPQVAQAEEQARRVERQLEQREREMDALRQEHVTKQQGAQQLEQEIVQLQGYVAQLVGDQKKLQTALEFQRATARQEAANGQLKSIQAALELYAIGHDGAYPASLSELTVADDGGTTYLSESALTDPWGNAIKYEAPDKEHVLPRVSIDQK